jgi:hypothetical protein
MLSFTYNKFCPGYFLSALVQTISGFLGRLFFRKEKSIRNCAHLMLVTQSSSGNKSHGLHFLGDFLSCPLPEIVQDNTLQNWRLKCLYRSSKAKITSDVLEASLNNSFKDYWHLCIKTYINDRIVRSDCKLIGLHSG